MSRDPSHVVNAKPGKATVTIGGIGSGTGVVAIAQNIGLTTTPGIVLAYLAPLVAYLTGAVFYFAQLQVRRFLEWRMLNSARKTLARQLDNPIMSESHKRRIRHKLEELEELVADAEIARVKEAGQLSQNEPGQ